ncbi:MAG: alpha/beta hydrolase fold domain-containing protein [Alphaproteobacteria bacterium]|nr:alpha/beta hydrolase fold domain-containing protein [Alphaproteobacteria bacterium]
MTDTFMANGKELHPDMKPMLDARGGAGPAVTIEEQRAAWTNYSNALSKPHPADMAVDDRTLSCGHGEVRVRVYRPASAAAAAPCIIYSHGGGFMKGDLDSSDNFAWGVSEETNAVVVSVDYRLAPEHPFPAAFDDVYGTVCYIAENAAEFSIDPSRLAVCGDSAGGNLSAAACLAARDKDGPRIAAQSLIYPGTGLDQIGGSYDENADAPGLTKLATMKYRDLYLTRPEDHENPYARPVIAKNFTGLPPAYIHTAQHDPIRDDGEIYAEKLRAGGVDVTYRCAKFMIHGFLRARALGPGGRAEFESIVSWLNDRLA